MPLNGGTLLVYRSIVVGRGPAFAFSPTTCTSKREGRSKPNWINSYPFESLRNHKY